MAWLCLTNHLKARRFSSPGYLGAGESSRSRSALHHRSGKEGQASPSEADRNHHKHHQHQHHHSRRRPLSSTSSSTHAHKQGSWAQHHQRRNQSPGGPGSGRQDRSSHLGDHGGGSGGSAQGSDGRASPSAGQGSHRGSPNLARAHSSHGSQGSPAPLHGSPSTMALHSSRTSPGGTHAAVDASTDTGDAPVSKGGSRPAAAAPGPGVEINGWNRRPRGTVVTDKMLLLKSEFLELYDMLMESDCQWEESQLFCNRLQDKLGELTLVPQRHRDTLPAPR